MRETLHTEAGIFQLIKQQHQRKEKRAAKEIPLDPISNDVRT